MIDWATSESHVLLNPRLPASDRLALERFATPLESQVWLATSGTSGDVKLVALSKQALLASAAAVNRHLEAGPDDVWCRVLPSFHVGGLAIHARAFLTGSVVVEGPWSVEGFLELSRTRSVTLTSLVPAQVSDLCTAGVEPPPSLRAVIVGGGALPDSLYGLALAAGWPLLPSYGLTECCSQVATAKLGSPELILLDHFEARCEEDGRLALRGDALLTGYGTPLGFIDPKVDGWFVTDDLGEVDGAIVRVAGRGSDFVKIGGESVDLARLDRILAEVAGPEAALAAVPDDRLGHVIALAVAAGDPQMIREAFDKRVMPFERIRVMRRVAAIPRTALGKVIRSTLTELFR